MYSSTAKHFLNFKLIKKTAHKPHISSKMTNYMNSNA